MDAQGYRVTVAKREGLTPAIDRSGLTAYQAAKLLGEWRGMYCRLTLPSGIELDASESMSWQPDLLAEQAPTSPGSPARAEDDPLERMPTAEEQGFTVEFLH